MKSVSKTLAPAVGVGYLVAPGSVVPSAARRHGNLTEPAVGSAVQLLAAAVAAVRP